MSKIIYISLLYKTRFDIFNKTNNMKLDYLVITNHLMTHNIIIQMMQEISTFITYTRKYYVDFDSGCKT